MRWLTQHYYRTGAGKPDATMENLLRRDDNLIGTLRRHCARLPGSRGIRLPDLRGQFLFRRRQAGA